MGGKSKFGAPPLMTWVTGKKSFDESLRTSGSPLEQSINKGVLKAIGRGPKDNKKDSSNKKSSGDSSNNKMADYMSEMGKTQAKQFQLARKAQREAFLESQRQSAQLSAQQGELAAKQMLAQTGAMQQARDISAKEAQQKAYGSMGQSAIGEGFDINQAKQEQLANLSGTGAIPTTSSSTFYGIDTAKTAQPAIAPKKPANVFALPEYQTIKFGGM